MYILQSANSLRIPWVSCVQQAHYRLSWQERLARDARTETAGQLTLKLFGLPEGFASWLGLTGAEREYPRSARLNTDAQSSSRPLVAHPVGV